MDGLLKQSMQTTCLLDAINPGMALPFNVDACVRTIKKRVIGSLFQGFQYFLMSESWTPAQYSQGVGDSHS